MSAAPFTQAEFAAALDAIGGFEPHPSIAVAVSGGPDSMALAILADPLGRERGGIAWVLTVDHGLRPGSADEARQVAGWLAARAIPHAVLAWIGDKPGTGVQEAARAARYHLLAGWCGAHGVLHLLTAHHREDQAETYLIRRRAGSGVDGLAAMSAVRELPGCRLVRPLLAVPKARLAALLSAEQQPFLSDPSNRSPAFERARLRSGDGILADPATLAAVAAELREHGRERLRRERALDALLARTVSLHPAGFAVLAPALFATAAPELAERLLGRVAATIGGALYPLRRERLARLRAGLAASPGRARTLGGCRFVWWRGNLLVLREPAHAEAPLRLVPGDAILWDQRFALSLPAAADRAVTIGYLGTQRPGAETAGLLPRLLYPILPAVWDAAGLLAVPALSYRRCREVVLPRIAFNPANRLTHAGFTVV